MQSSKFANKKPTNGSMSKQILKLLIAFSMVFMVSCDRNEDGVYTLTSYYSSTSYQTSASAEIRMDSTQMTIIYHHIRSNHEKSLLKTYKRMQGGFYEQYVITDFDRPPIDTNYVLAFCKSDTTVRYVFDQSYYSTSVGFLGMLDWEYDIVKVDQSNFILFKKHLTNNAFREEFYYDNAFHISEIRLYHGSDTLLFR